MLGLTLHTFFDGVAIASGFLVSGRLGILLFLAVLLHKLPEGVTIASVMVAGGQSRARAVGAAAVLGGATVLGVLLTEQVAPLARHGLALSAGVTLYVAASNLVPEFQSKRGWLTAPGVLRGRRGILPHGAAAGRLVEVDAAEARRSRQSSLFTAGRETRPLAARMRPATLDEFVGQEHLLGPGKPLRDAIERGAPGSMIFWGPPGSGKTTLAHLVATSTARVFVPFSAVTEGVPRIREIVTEARERLESGGEQTILFVDEIHRLNKAQQDSLLPAGRRRHHHPDRRHHRESQLRGDRRAALADPGVRPPAAQSRRTSRAPAAARPDRRRARTGRPRG